MILPQAVVHSAQGQDRSNFQPITPWTGCDFGFAKATEGTTFTDATFAANWRNMKTAGIIRGAYAFWHPLLDPVIQARFFVGTVMKQGLEPGDFLVADIEITAGGPLGKLRRALGRERLLPRQNVPADVAGLTASSVDIRAKAFLDEVSALAGPHNPVFVYTNLSVGSLLRSCTSYPLIIAFPSSAAPASVAPWKTWQAWQWGIVSGIDRDAWNGTRDDLHAWFSRFKPQPKPPPPPAPGAVPLGGDMIVIPPGAGAEACYLVPQLVLGLTGTAAPTVMRFSSHAAAHLEWNTGDVGDWNPVTLDFLSSPYKLALTPGTQVIKVRRVDKGTNAVTADFA